MADGQHMWNDSEPRVDTSGIYVENHQDWNRECFIWIRFVVKRCEKGSLPALLEDHMISETCHLEENASHHARFGGDPF